jgi:hypothetical protein
MGARQIPEQWPKKKAPRSAPVSQSCMSPCPGLGTLGRAVRETSDQATRGRTEHQAGRREEDEHQDDEQGELDHGAGSRISS